MTTAEADAAAGGRGSAAVAPPLGALPSSNKKLSRRESRQLANAKNTWVQHPNIINPQQRARAYLRTAGLVTAPATAPVLNDDSPSVPPHEEPERQFMRLLGSPDQRVRHSAVTKLSSYLQARSATSSTGLSELDLLKLWKALWYALYRCDKVPVQEELAKHMAHLLWCFVGTKEQDEYACQAYLDYCASDQVGGDDDAEDGSHGSDSEDDSHDSDAEDKDDEQSGGENDDDADAADDTLVPHCRGAHLVSLFVRTCFRTIRREWHAMDKYRINKFYTLVRLVIYEMYRYMARRQWHLGLIQLFNDSLMDEVFSANSCNGLRYHVVDVTLEELARVHRARDNNDDDAMLPLTEATFLEVLQPYTYIAHAEFGDDILQQRCIDNIFVKFLDQYSIVSDRAVEERNQADEGESTDDAVATGLLNNVHVGTVAQFLFKVAEDDSTCHRYRKSLYDLYKRYARRLKQAGNLDVVRHIDGLGEAGNDGMAAESSTIGLVQNRELKRSVERANTDEPRNATGMNKKSKTSSGRAEHDKDHGDGRCQCHDHDSIQESTPIPSRKKKRKESHGAQSVPRQASSSETSSGLREQRGVKGSDTVAMDKTPMNRKESTERRDEELQANRRMSKKEKNQLKETGTKHLVGNEQINLTSVETSEGDGGGTIESEQVRERKKNKKKRASESPKAVDESTSLAALASSRERNHSKSHNPPSDAVGLHNSEANEGVDSWNREGLQPDKPKMSHEMKINSETISTADKSQRAPPVLHLSDFDDQRKNARAVNARLDDQVDLGRSQPYEMDVDGSIELATTKRKRNKKKKGIQESGRPRLGPAEAAGKSDKSTSAKAVQDVGRGLDLSYTAKRQKLSRNGCGEEVITISMGQQFMARAAEEKRQRQRSVSSSPIWGRKQKQESDSPREREDSVACDKKVSFANSERTRSWKASINGLRQLQYAPPPIPVQGILRKKERSRSVDDIKSRSKFTQRRRATDYF
jgi:Nucleolar protein,Nop52